MRKNLSLEMDLTLEPRFTKEFVIKKKDDITLDISLKNENIPVIVDNQVARLFVRKQDGSIIVQGGTEEVGDGSIILGGNVVRIHLKNSATNTTGLCYAELELQDDEGVMATHSFIFEVVDRLNDIDEAIKAVDDIYILKEIENFIIQSKAEIEELKKSVEILRRNVNGAIEILNNSVKEFEERLENANADIDDKINHYKEIEETLLAGIEDFKNAYSNVGEDLALIKEEAIVDIDNLRKWSLTELEDYYNNCVDSLTLHYKNFYAILRGHTSELKLELSRERDKILTALETAKNDAITQITSLFNQYMISMDEKFESSIGEIEEKMGQALRNISDATDTSLETIQNKADDIMEQIENIEIGSIEGVNQAVEEAERRLQEEAIKQNWNIQQVGKEEGDKLISSLQEKTSELKDDLEATTNNHIGNINQAGQDIISAVENLEANIEQGLTDINNATNTGKEDIKELSNSYLNRIETEGEEIVEAVRNLEITTTESIERVNNAKESAITSIERAGLSEINSIKAESSEKKAEIRELTNAKLEEITTTSDNKLEEINSILGVSKGEVEELLNTTRQEINTHRNNINSTVNEGIENINNLKTNSINEMTNAKDNLLEEILGAEVELEKDFEEMHQNIIDDINTTGNNKMEALNNLIERINQLELEIEKNLENSDKRAENLENTIENIDNKIVDITPVLNNLDELRALCLDLKNQNETAKTSLEDLEYWTLEADVRIVELRRLIEEAKQYEEVVQRWIDARGGNHEEIEARLHALEESVIAMDDAINTLEQSFSSYYTKEETYSKEEIEKLFDNTLNDYTPGKLVGRFGESQYFHSSKRFTTEKEATLTFEPKHIFQFSYFASSNYQYITFYFNCDLDNDPNKYISMNGNKITLNGMKAGVDYVAVAGKATGSTSTTSFTFDNTYRISSLDFNIYNTDRSAILVNNPKTAGLSNFNEAIETGKYTIDLSLNAYKGMPGNAPIKGEANNITGILEVINIGNKTVQRKTLYSIGEQYIRILGENWTRIDSNKNNENIAEIKVSDSLAIPNIALSAPRNPFFWIDSSKVGYATFRTQENHYYALYTYNKALNINLDNTWVSKYGNLICIKNNYSDIALFKCTDGINWVSADGSFASYDNPDDIKYNPDYFRVYSNSHAIKAHPSNGTIYQEPTEMNADGENTLQDFNNATVSGTYKVSINEGDEILNSPILITNENDEVITGALNGVLIVDIAGNTITQEVRSVEGNTYTRIYNETEWTNWEEGAGKVDIDLSLYATKEDLSLYATKEDLNNIEIPEVPEIDLSNYTTVSDVENMINELIETPKVNIIENLNSIIGGM